MALSHLSCEERRLARSISRNWTSFLQGRARLRHLHGDLSVFLLLCLFIPQVLYEGFLELGCGGRSKASQMAQFMLGGLAGTLCWLSVLPFDVVKSRMQALDGRHYTSLVHCALDSYKKEGAKVFMRGGLAMALRAFPVNGVTFLVYEVLLDLCQNR